MISRGLLLGYSRATHVRSISTNRILCTGCSGQIGAGLVSSLRGTYGNENVIASDVRSPCKNLRLGGPFKYLDVLNQSDIKRVVVESEIDTIVHLAAILSAKGEKNPSLALKINNEGIQNILNVAAEEQLKVFTPSSIAVYGDQSLPKVNTPEDCELSPKTMYGITKVHSELLGEYYARNFGVDFRSLRLPGVISHSEPGGGTTDYAVEIFKAAVNIHHSYTCFLSPKTELPMIYMPDLLRGIIQFLDAPNKLLTRRTYNLGALSFTPQELSSSIQKYIPSFTINYKLDYREDIAKTWPKSVDSSCAARDWGWSAMYGLDELTHDMLQRYAPNTTLMNQKYSKINGFS